MKCFMAVVVALAVSGCVTRKPNPTDVVNHERSAVATEVEMSRRQFTATQIDVLRSFALTEAPQLWQMVQSIKAGAVSQKAALARLREEMEAFGRDPNTDPDVAALSVTQRELENSVTSIYIKLEEAYIAYKKMQATPGRSEYAKTMRTALEDGVKEADRMTLQFKDMSRNK